jgi:superfamily I DNA/RNA helicase
MARAKLLAEDPARRILVLCFNKVLAKYLAGCLADHLNIDVRHFHGWGARNGVRFTDAEDFEEYGGRLLRRLEDGEGDFGRYDSVLIDEAQDFACAWFRCARMALKDPDDGDLMVVGDGSQTVYRKRSFTWAEAGIHARGRTINRKFDLDKNYRNTSQILAAAQSFAGQETPESSDAAIRSFRVDPSAAVRSGPWPIVLQEPDRHSEVSAVAELIRTWLAAGVEIEGAKVRLNPSDIGVLYPRRPNDNAVGTLRMQLSNVAPVITLAGEKADGDPLGNGVKITTVHSAKGLQFRAVVLVWGDLLPSRRRDRSEAEERSLFYVALTRAEDVLVVTQSRASRYIDELQSNIASASNRESLARPL